MNPIEEKMCFEHKIDRISEIMEEILLDAMMAALQKIKDRNLIFNKIAQDRDLNNIQF
jgi:hypothetical protein